MGRALRWVPALVALVAGAVAATGLLWRPSGHPVQVTTVRGQSVELAGDGLYRYDTVFTAAGNTAVDVVVLVLAVPLLLSAWRWHRTGSPRGSVLLTGALGYLLYQYANEALGVAYNPLYLAYVLALAGSLFGFITAFVTADRASLAVVAVDPRVPHRGLSWFLLVAAGVTAVVWLQPLVTALLAGAAPSRLDVYTTPVTWSLDLAVIVPAAALAGLLVRRRSPLGHLLAAPLLVTIVLLVSIIALSTVLQASAGVSFTAGEAIGPIAGFTVLGALGAWLLLRLLRAVPASLPAPRPARTHGVDVHV